MSTEAKQVSEAAPRYLALVEAEEVPAGYKRTEVGVIPEDWQSPTVRDIASPARNAIVGGPFGSDLVSKDYVEHGVPVIRGQNMSGQWVSGDFVFVSPLKARLLEANLAHPGDIVFTQRGTLGQVSLVPEIHFDSYLVSQSQMKLTVNQDLADPLFFFYVFTSEGHQKLIVGARIQTGVPHINLGILRDIPVQVPPLSEQHAIAEALSDVDGLLGALEALIAKKRAIKQGTMQQLLTGKTRLPGFSGEWETKHLGEDITLLSGHHVMTRHCNTQGIGMPYLTGPADFPNGRISQTKFTEKPTTFCELGDILVTVKGSGSGTLIMADGEYCISRQLMAIRTSRWNREFLFYSLCQNATRIAAASTGLIPGLSRQDILEQELPVPSSASEQTTIATVLSHMDAEIAALEARRDKTRALKQGMMQQLLTGRIRLVEPQERIRKVKEKDGNTHESPFREAVVISLLTKQFATEQYPLGRKRYTKLSYLLHRHADGRVGGYLKKAAGPYNPKTKYGGPERIAIENGYVREHSHGSYRGFVPGENVAQAEGYFTKWYGIDRVKWLEQFRFKTNDDLEVLATVDMAAEELRSDGKAVTLEAVKGLIQGHPEWKAKLDRPAFSDAEIIQAIKTSSGLFRGAFDL